MIKTCRFKKNAVDVVYKVLNFIYVAADIALFILFGLIFTCMFICNTNFVKFLFAWLILLTLQKMFSFKFKLL